MRQAEEFQAAAEKLQITRWVIRKCSLCSYPLSYNITGAGIVTFDSGCDCTRGSMVVHDSSFEKIAEFYNIQTNVKVIAEMDEIWGFEPEGAKP